LTIWAALSAPKEEEKQEEEENVWNYQGLSPHRKGNRVL
jgi:hypothetical protein